jgi:UDP-GlcNAc:undecaprenyl-phosphate/decaprenyl-phosphate GlcNAc-1-phosphate transferase
MSRQYCQGRKMLMNDALLFPFALAAAGFSATFFAVPHAVRLAMRYGLVDHPSLRKIHDHPTPLCGGIAIFVPVFISLVGFTVLGYFQYFDPGRSPIRSIALIVASMWMFFLGLVDDKRQLSWRQKLVGQSVGILILILGGHSVLKATIPFLGPVDFGLTGPIIFGLAVLVVTNAINLIDGLDGVAGGICLFTSLVYGIVGFFKGDLFACTIGFVLSGSLLGFLPFNLPPAKVFLGDAGSLTLGLLLGTLATSYASTMFPGQRSATLGVVLAPFLPFTIALLDVVIAIVRRWIRGGRIFLPDSDHLHHRLLAEFKSPRLAVGVIYVISLLFAALSVMVALTSEPSFSLAYYGLIVTCAVVLSALILRSYRVDHLPQVLIDRPAFRFLDAYRNFVLARVLRAKSEEELIGILQSGVNDLQFDSVEVSWDEDRTVTHWARLVKVHAEAPRVVIEKSFKDLGLSIRATLPTHNSEPYQKYLESVWVDALNSFALAYAKTTCPREQIRRAHTDSNNLEARSAIK